VTEVALVTGAGAGIGRAVARRLGAEGYGVLVADVDEAGGLATVEAIEAAGGSASFARFDVRRDAEAMVEAAGPELSVLVNNAGGYSFPVFPDAPVEHWSDAVDLNLGAVMRAIHAAVPVLERHGGGAIVNVASAAGLGLAPYGGPEYAVAKAGVIRLTASLASLAERGIRVTCVAPYTVATEGVLAAIAEYEARGEEPSPDLVGTLLSLDEVADAVLGLAGDESLAGRVLFLRGGREPRLLAADDPLDWA
jgi:NAD(P)-dependent dehydrogenase (short-subunit alcohol dehydrogenase family)